MEVGPPGEITEAPTARQVLSQALRDLPADITTIEVLELRQATPEEYMVRVVTGYGAPPQGYVVRVKAQAK